MHAMVDRDERQIQSLIRLIEDMLDVSRIRTGKLSIRPGHFDLCQLVRNLLENFAPQVAAAESSVQFDAPQPVEGNWDEFRIEQVVSNLLTNALRYGAKSPVEVRVYAEHGEARVECVTMGLASAKTTRSEFFNSSSGFPPTMQWQGWGWGCLFPSRSSLLTAGRLRLRAG